MSFEIKICGITTPEAIDAAAAAGADAIGFIFAESIRQIGIQRAGELARLCPPTLSRVAVFKHPAPEEVALVLESVDVDWVQSDAADYETIAGVLDGIPFRPVYRCLDTNAPQPHQTEPGPLQTLPESLPSLHESIASGNKHNLNAGPILVEGPRSGSGITADWAQIAALPSNLHIVLAGGLTPDNVNEAIRIVRPRGVDTSSGVESEPGVKDPAMIKAFIVAARKAARNHESQSKRARR